MRVCYKPHTGYNLTAGSVLHTDGHGSKQACRGKPADSICGPGMYKLDLPLTEKERKICGTIKVRDVSRLYKNT